MPNPDTRIWELLDRAANHLILARFGRHSEVAQARLYGRAAGFLMEAVEAIVERAREDEPMEGAERMIGRAYGK